MPNNIYNEIIKEFDIDKLIKKLKNFKLYDNDSVEIELDADTDADADDIDVDVEKESSDKNQDCENDLLESDDGYSIYEENSDEEDAEFSD